MKEKRKIGREEEQKEKRKIGREQEQRVKKRKIGREEEQNEKKKDWKRARVEEKDVRSIYFRGSRDPPET